MDAKDVRIFCEMSFKYLDYNAFSGRHVSPSRIGEKLGLDEKTVRRRIRKMEDEGFIKYYQAIPNLGLFGLKSLGLYSFEAADIPSKREAVKYFQEASGIVEVYDLLGPSFQATLAGTSAEEVQSLASELTRKLNLKTQSRIGNRTPKATLYLPSKLDWEIVRRLRYDALCPATQVGETISVTPRMVEYRISKLLGSAALFIRAVMNAQKQHSLVFYGLLLSLEETLKRGIVNTVRGMLGEAVWLLLTPMPGVVVANAFAFGLGAPEEVVDSVARLKGVSGCSLSIFKETIEPKRPNWIDALVDERITNS